MSETPRGKDSPIQSMQDVIDLDRPFKVPSQGVDDDFYAMAMLADTLGFEVEVITGYEGGRTPRSRSSRATATAA